MSYWLLCGIRFFSTAIRRVVGARSERVCCGIGTQSLRG